MTTKYLPPLFNAQFFDDDGTVLAGGFLYTYASGTTDPQTTYQDQAGGTPNSNPIELDADGRCNLWLSSGSEYTFALQRADTSAVKTWDNIGAVAGAGSVVTSVNTLTGAVTLTADDITFATGTSTDWFVGTDVSAALDALIDRADTNPASSISIADAGNHFAAVNVEAALQEVAGWTDALQAQVNAALPNQAGNSGKFLSTNGSATAWTAAVTGSHGPTSADQGSVMLAGNFILKWGFLPITAGDNNSSDSLSFNTPFPTVCYHISGNGDDTANASAIGWSVVFTSLTRYGCTVQCDTHNTGENFSTGRAVRWFAIGN